MERVIIRKLHEKERKGHLRSLGESMNVDVSRLLEELGLSEDSLMEAEGTRRGPIDMFFAWMDGTLNRLISINQKYNTPEQQRLVYDYIISHLEFLLNNQEAIRRILETPEGAPTGLNLRDYVFESTYSIDYAEVLNEAATPMEMFFREFDELYKRAKDIDQKFNDPEQKKEFDLVVMSRLDYIKSIETEFLKILQADPNENISDVFRAIENKLRKAKTALEIVSILDTPLEVSEPLDSAQIRSIEMCIEDTMRELPFGDTPTFFGLFSSNGKITREGEWIVGKWRDKSLFTMNQLEDGTYDLDFIGYPVVRATVENRLSKLLSTVDIEVKALNSYWFSVAVRIKPSLRG